MRIGGILLNSFINNNPNCVAQLTNLTVVWSLVERNVSFRTTAFLLLLRRLPVEISRRDLTHFRGQVNQHGHGIFTGELAKYCKKTLELSWWRYPFNTHTKKNISTNASVQFPFKKYNCTFFSSSFSRKR